MSRQRHQVEGFHNKYRKPNHHHGTVRCKNARATIKSVKNKIQRLSSSSSFIVASQGTHDTSAPGRSQSFVRLALIAAFHIVSTSARKAVPHHVILRWRECVRGRAAGGRGGACSAQRRVVEKRRRERIASAKQSRAVWWRVSLSTRRALICQCGLSRWRLLSTMQMHGCYTLPQLRGQHGPPRLSCAATVLRRAPSEGVPHTMETVDTRPGASQVS